MDSLFTILFFGPSEPTESRIEDVDIELADEDSSTKSGGNCVIVWYVQSLTLSSHCSLLLTAIVPIDFASASSTISLPLTLAGQMRTTPSSTSAPSLNIPPPYPSFTIFTSRSAIRHPYHYYVYPPDDVSLYPPLFPSEPLWPIRSITPSSLLVYSSGSC